MTNILNYVGVAIAGLVVGLLLAPTAQTMFGGVYSQVSNEFYQGLKVGTSNQLVIDSDGDITTALDVDGDGTVAGGTLTVTTANTATSTVIAGCYQFYATSTATPLKYQASTTPGVMVSVYGSCPNL